MPVVTTSITVNGITCEDPKSLIKQFDEQGLDLDKFAGLANTFTNPRGFEVGKGYVLLTKKNLDLLNLDAYTNTLTFHCGSTTKSFTKLAVGVTQAVTPLQIVSDSTVYIVELLDLRQLGKFTDINKTYNIASPLYDGVNYYPASLNSGVKWTWTTLIADIWTNMPSVMGASLDITSATFPDGDPENYSFQGMSAWEALRIVLNDVRHYLILSPTGSFSIVPADEQLGLATTKASHVTSLSDIDHPLAPSGVAVLPENLIVYFPKKDFAFQDSLGVFAVTGKDHQLTDAFHAETIATSTVETTAEGITTIVGTRLAIRDTMYAVYSDAGTLLNSTALSNRALSIASDVFNDEFYSKDTNTEIYCGVITEFIPDSQVDFVAYYDVGDILYTKVSLSPPSFVRDLTPVQPEELIPTERLTVVRLIGNLVAGGVATGRPVYGTESTTITWNDTSANHDIQVHEHTGVLSYVTNDRLLVWFNQQVKEWIVFGTATSSGGTGWILDGVTGGSLIVATGDKVTFIAGTGITTAVGGSDPNWTVQHNLTSPLFTIEDDNAGTLIVDPGGNRFFLGGTSGIRTNVSGSTLEFSMELNRITSETPAKGDFISYADIDSTPTTNLTRKATINGIFGTHEIFTNSGSAIKGGGTLDTEPILELDFSAATGPSAGTPAPGDTFIWGVAVGDASKRSTISSVFGQFAIAGSSSVAVTGSGLLNATPAISVTGNVWTAITSPATSTFSSPYGTQLTIDGAGGIVPSISGSILTIDGSTVVGLYNWTISGDTGIDTITDGTTLAVSGVGIDSTVSVDSLTLKLDFANAGELATIGIPVGSDWIAIADDSDVVGDGKIVNKVTVDNLLGVRKLTGGEGIKIDGLSTAVDLSGDRTFTLDYNEIIAITPVSGDWIQLLDISPLGNGSATIATVFGLFSITQGDGISVTNPALDDNPTIAHDLSDGEGIRFSGTHPMTVSVNLNEFPAQALTTLGTDFVVIIDTGIEKRETIDNILGVRTINTTGGLTGGGDLSANLTLDASTIVGTYTWDIKGDGVGVTTLSDGNQLEINGINGITAVLTANLLDISGSSLVPTSRTLQGDAGIEIADVVTAVDLSANRKIAFAPERLVGVTGAAADRFVILDDSSVNDQKGALLNPPTLTGNITTGTALRTLVDLLEGMGLIVDTTGAS